MAYFKRCPFLFLLCIFVFGGAAGAQTPPQSLPQPEALQSPPSEKPREAVPSSLNPPVMRRPDKQEEKDFERFSLSLVGEVLTLKDNSRFFLDRDIYVLGGPTLSFVANDLYYVRAYYYMGRRHNASDEIIYNALAKLRGFEKGVAKNKAYKTGLRLLPRFKLSENCYLLAGISYDTLASAEDIVFYDKNHHLRLGNIEKTYVDESMSFVLGTDTKSRSGTKTILFHVGALTQKRTTTGEESYKSAASTYFRLETLNTYNFTKHMDFRVATQISYDVQHYYKGVPISLTLGFGWHG